MPILHTALHSEAKIFKEEFNLSKIESYRKIEIFSRDDIVLVVSGIGKISTSIAIALASVLKPNCRDFYLNFGIAGSAKKEHALGDLRMIDKVVDLAENATKLGVLSKNIRKFAKPQAAKEIVEEIFKVTQQ